MAHACGCHSTSSTRVEVARRAAYRADQKVKEVGKTPAALAVPQEMGVNHSCGAHLTLAEAGAPA